MQMKPAFFRRSPICSGFSSLDLRATNCFLSYFLWLWLVCVVFWLSYHTVRIHMMKTSRNIMRLKRLFSLTQQQSAADEKYPMKHLGEEFRVEFFSQWECCRLDGCSCYCCHTGMHGKSRFLFCHSRSCPPSILGSCNWRHILFRHDRQNNLLSCSVFHTSELLVSITCFVSFWVANVNLSNLGSLEYDPSKEVLSVWGETIILVWVKDWSM